METKINFSIIVAIDENYGIGKNNKIPWRIESDMKYFKEITTKTNDENKMNACIMGRKTYESIPIKFRPLPGRLNIVLSKNQDLIFENTIISHSLDEALNVISTKDNIENVFITGGAELYREAIESPLLTKMYITRIYKNFECDTFFPNFEKNLCDQFVLEKEEDEAPLYLTKNINFKFLVYNKK